MTDIVLTRGWHQSRAAQVAELYEEAFGPKFSKAIPDKQARIEVLAQCFVPEFSYVVTAHDEVVGLAGFQTSDGSLTGGMSLRRLLNKLGWLKGLWAALVFSLFERQPQAGELVMDGIVVDRRFRGQGLGSRLLDQIIQHAKEHGFQTVRLDVIDTNPRARKLYEAKGFVATKTERFPYLKWLVGFSGATTMVFTFR